MALPYNIHPLASVSHVSSPDASNVTSPPDTPDGAAGSPLAVKATRQRPYAIGQVAASMRNFEAPTDYLLIVVPSAKMALLLSRMGQSGLERGILVNLYPTLSGQLAAVARHLHLPSTTGLVVYVNEVYSLSTHDAAFSQSAGPRIADDAWPVLWAAKLEPAMFGQGADDFDAPPVPPIPSTFLAERNPDESSGDESSYFQSEAPPMQVNISQTSSRFKRSPATRSSSAASTRHPQSMSFSSSSQGNRSASSLSSHSVMKPPSSGVIAGKVELDLDQRGEKWLDEWVSRRARFTNKGAVISASPSLASIAAEDVPAESSPTAVHSAAVEAALADNVSPRTIRADLPSRTSSRMSSNAPSQPFSSAHSATDAEEPTEEGYAPLGDGDSDTGAVVAAVNDPLADVFGRDEAQWSHASENPLKSSGSVRGLQIDTMPDETPEQNGELPPADDVAEVREMLREHKPKEPSLSSPVPVASPRFHSDFVASLEQTPTEERDDALEQTVEEAPATATQGERGTSSGVNWAEAVANTFGSFALRRKVSESSTIHSHPSLDAPPHGRMHSDASQRSSVLLQRTLDEADAAVADLATLIKSPGSPPNSGRFPRTAMYQSLRSPSPISPTPGSPVTGRKPQLAEPILDAPLPEPPSADREITEEKQAIEEEEPLLPPPAPLSRAQSPSPGLTRSPARTTSLAASASPLMASTATVPPLPPSPALLQSQSPFLPASEAVLPPHTSTHDENPAPAQPMVADAETAVTASASTHEPVVDGTAGEAVESRIVESPVEAAADLPSPPLFSPLADRDGNDRPDSAMTTMTSKTTLPYLGPVSPPVGASFGHFPEMEPVPPLPTAPVSQSEVREKEVESKAEETGRATPSRSGSRLKGFGGSRSKGTSPSRADIEAGSSPSRQTFSFKSFFGKRGDEPKSPLTISAPMPLPLATDISTSSPIKGNAADVQTTIRDTDAHETESTSPTSPRRMFGRRDTKKSDARAATIEPFDPASTGISPVPSPNLRSDGQTLPDAHDLSSTAQMPTTPLRERANSRRDSASSKGTSRTPGKGGVQRSATVNDDLDHIMAQLSDLQHSDEFKPGDSAQPLPPPSPSIVLSPTLSSPGSLAAPNAFYSSGKANDSSSSLPVPKLPRGPSGPTAPPPPRLSSKRRTDEEDSDAGSNYSDDENDHNELL